MRRSYRANESVLNWLYAGPYMLDVSQRYTDNYLVDFCAYEDLWDEAARLLEAGAAPRENENHTLWGQQSAWKKLSVHPADTQMTWAKFGTNASLLATFTDTRLFVNDSGRCAFHVKGTGAYRILINGKPAAERREVGRVDFDDAFEFDLLSGENHVRILLFNVHLHCQNILRFTLNAPCEAEIELIPLSPELRQTAERALSDLYLSDSALLPGKTISLLGAKALSEGEVSYRLVSPSGETVNGGALNGAPATLLAAGDAGADGLYTVETRYTYGQMSVEGRPLTFNRFSFFDDVPDADLNGRKAYLLNRFADMRLDAGRAGVYVEIAKFASGQPEKFDKDALMKTVRYINDRYDCADFAMHGILRFYKKYASHPAVPQDVRLALEDCILNFKYWVDEPGRSLMFTRSENHEMLFYSAEYVAGSLFPDRVFANSGQNGLFHALKGRMLAEHWIREKGYHGFTEWHSNCYYEEDILALLSIWDFGEENGLLRQLAHQLLSAICYFMASNSSHGVMATTHGRCYETALMHPASESVSRVNYLLFGEPKKLVNALSIGAVALADSAYAPPAISLQMQRESEMETLSRMGLFRREGQRGVCCSTYRTAHYMVSGLIESKAGEHGAQVNAGQALLEGETPVFVTCFANRAPNTRPSYFGGQFRVPKTVARKNVLAYIFDIKDVAGHTHCYFPMSEMDKVRREGQWIFAQKGEAYIGVYCTAPFTVTNEGAYRERELLTLEKHVTWLMELGDRAAYASFDVFAGALLAARIENRAEGLCYASPSQGEMFFSANEPCTVNAQAVAPRDMPLILNPFVRSEYGSGIYETADGRAMDFFA